MAESESKALALTRDRYQLTANKFDASGTSMFNKDQLQILHDPTPAIHIHTLPSAAGKKAGLPYVTGGYVKHVLTRLFGGNWSFEIKEKGIQEGEIWILGRLIVPNAQGGTVVHEQFGGAVIKKLRDGKGNVSLANDMKAAATDSLKKCASELGIAGDVYNANEFIDARIIDEDGVDLEATGASDDAGSAQGEQTVNEPVDPEKVATADYRRETEAMLNERYPVPSERVKFIKTVTGRVIIFRQLSATHVVWLREALEFEKNGGTVQ